MLPPQGRVVALVVALALTASMFAYHAGYAVPIGDELDILKPAVEHMHGVLRPDVKYPSFPFLFYGACLRLSGTLEDPQRALVVARAVNASLLGVAVMLIYALARELVRQPFALLAALAHLMMPNTLGTARIVKTEGLLVVETLVCLLAVRQICRKPSSLGAHVVAAIAVGLGVTTKLSVYPAFLYLASWLFVCWRLRQPPGWRAALVFVASLCLTVCLTGANLQLLPQMIDFWQSDHYFQPNASPMRAIPSLSAFPYDRYTSFFLTTLPLALGWPIYLFGVSGVFAKLQRGWYGWVVGLGTLAASIVAIQATLLRVPHSFTTLYLWAAVSVAIAAQHFWDAEGKTRQLPRRVGVLLALVCSAAYAGVALREMEAVWPDQLLASYSRDSRAKLFTSSRSRQPDSETIRAQVERAGPTTLVLFNSYFINMCRYRDHRLYRDNCRYFEELVSGRTSYRLVREIPFAVPWAFLQLDPAIRRSRFYVLTRDDPPR